MLREITDYVRYMKVSRDTPHRDEALQLIVKSLGSPSLAQMWIKVPLPLLGGVTPYQLISEGRSKSLLKFLRETLPRYENKVH